MSHDSEQRTEQPTPNKRDEARSQGRVPRSRDLTVALSLLGGFTAIRYLAPQMGMELGSLTRKLLGMIGSGAEILTVEGVNSLATNVGMGLVRVVLPMVLLASAITFAFAMLQSGFVLRWAAVQPELGRLNPASGFQRLGTLGSAGRGVFAILKVLVVGWLLFGAISSLMHSNVAPTLAAASFDVWGAAVGFGLRLGFALLVLAALDYLLQFWLHERSLRMTPAEVREENHRMEGDTSVKDRRRRHWSRVRQGADTSERSTHGGEEA